MSQVTLRQIKDTLRNTCGVGAAAAVMCFAAGGPAHAITVNPGQTLQLTFSVKGPDSVPYFPGVGGLALDTLSFFEKDGGTFINGVAQLYNGTTLLGTVDFSTGFLQTFSFTAPGGGYTFPPTGTVSDWSSLINGTIDGILDITFNAPINTTISFGALGVGFSDDEIANATYQPVLLSESILSATPLPPALPLFVGGLGMLAFFGWYRNRKAQAFAA